MLVQGATPLEVLRQYMAKADSPTRGRELNIHYRRPRARASSGQISHLGDMVPVMAGITLSFKMRSEPRVGLVYVGDGATRTGAFHEGINFAAVQRCPLVVIVREQRLRLLHAHRRSRRRRAASWTRRSATAFPASGPTATTCSRCIASPKAAVDARPRRARACTLIELMTYRRKGHAEHDNQSYVPAGEIEQWAATNDPLDRYVASVLTADVRLRRDELEAIDARCSSEIDAATELAEQSPPPDAREALSACTPTRR